MSPTGVLGFRSVFDEVRVRLQEGHNITYRAIGRLREAVETPEQRAEASLLVGKARASQGPDLWAEAQEAFEHGLRLESRSYIEGQLRFRLAQIMLWQRRDLDKALPQARAAAELLADTPGSPMIQRAERLVARIEKEIQDPSSMSDLEWAQSLLSREAYGPDSF